MFSTTGVPSAPCPTLTACNPATPKESLVEISVCKRAMMASTQSLELQTYFVSIVQTDSRKHQRVSVDKSPRCDLTHLEPLGRRRCSRKGDQDRIVDQA